MLLDMESQIHVLEQEAYIAVLRAFKAQADAITWDKEALITELRKELRVSDDEHRELLSRVNGDEIIQKIRDWRQGAVNHHTRYSAPQIIQEAIPSPTVSGSRKKQKTNRVVQPFPPKPKSYPPTNRRLTPPEGLIGQKVWTKWPEDNNFYEAVITDYNPSEGRHALVYDMNTPNETWEWVDLKEISPEDIRWERGEIGGSNRGGFGRGTRKFAGRGRGIVLRRDFGMSQNGLMRRNVQDIQLVSTESLVEEVERIFQATQIDPLELEKAKNMLKEQEMALVDAISRLGDGSDNESDEENGI